MTSGRVTVSDTLAALRRIGSGAEPVTATEIADELGLTRRTAYNKLEQLADRGDIRSKKVGAHSRVWWIDTAPPGQQVSQPDSMERQHELERYETIVETIEDGVYVVNADGEFVLVNDTYCDMTGYDREELLGSHVSLVVEDAVVESAHELDAELRDSTSKVTAEADLLNADGDRVPTEATFSLLSFNGEPHRVGVVRDITERKQRERALEESEQRFRAFVENFPNGAVALVDQDLTYQMVGGNPQKVADVRADEIESTSVREAIPAPLADALAPCYEAALDGETSTFEAEYDGRTFEFQVVPVHDDAGEVFAALGMSWEITEREAYRRQLEESEHRYRALAENFPNGAVGLYDEDLRYTAIGGDLLDTLDLDPEDRVGERIADIHPSDLFTKIEPHLRAPLDGETAAFEVEYMDRRLSAQTVPIRDADGDVTAGMLVIQDVTERWEAQRDLRESEAKFRMLAENLDEIVWMATPDAEEWLYINPAFEDVWGVDRDELYDDTLAFLEYVHPDDRDRVKAAFEALPEEPFEEEYRIVRPDGEVRWIRTDGRKVTAADGQVHRMVGTAEDITERKVRERELAVSEHRYRALAENFPNGGVGVYDEDLRYTLITGTMWDDIEPDASELEGEPIWEALPLDTAEDVEPVFQAALDGETGSVVSTLDGRTYRVWATPLRDADGEITAGQSFAPDITDRLEREQELEETVAELKASNDRLESFASMLAHELRNPVTIGQIYGGQLPADADEYAEAVEYVREAFDRIEDMIDVMLVLTQGRDAVDSGRAVDLAAVAREAWEEAVTHEATVDLGIDAEIEADETYIRHLFRNLMENAVEHGGANVTVTVGDLPTGFYVADDGSGIPAEDRDAVFETRYTTTSDAGGTGLGLAFVKELAAVYEWDVRLTESPDGGARFEFTNVE